MAAPVPAFPGAEGAGAVATGGRGGRVLKVTTLADSGPGSLRAAIGAKGPRTILFDVAGTIFLQAPIIISEGRLTIAGESAPGEGVTLAGHRLQVAADDVVIRFLRSRLGSATGTQDDAIWLSSGSRIILDHVSASWSVDETLSASASYRTPQESLFDVTVQWSIIANSLRSAGHVKGEHGYGSLIRAARGAQFSFHHNLWANHAARMPRPGSYLPAEEDPVGGRFDFRNNVFYNWGRGFAGYNADKRSLASYNFIGNAYLPGPDSKGRMAFAEQNPLARSWFAANSMDGATPEDAFAIATGVTSAQRLPKAIDMPPVATTDAETACRAVLADAGASMARDAVDRAVVAGVSARTGRIIDDERQDGGWPELRTGAPRRDSDGDGMPDDWERQHGLDPARDDQAADRDGDGYTNLEEWLNALAASRPGAGRMLPAC